MSLNDEDRIWDLVADWEESRQQGIDLTPEDICRDDPDSLEEVRERITAIKRMNFLTSGEDQDGEMASQISSHHLPVDHFDFLGPAQNDDEIGRLAHFRILKVLGRGGMGVVFLAEDQQLMRHVAIKVIAPGQDKGITNRKRFLQEAQAAAGIDHDNVVTIHQVGEHHGVLFLAMQLLEGEPLDDRLRREGKLTVSETVRIGKEVAQGLAAAHSKGLIHRDIKPSNLWIDSRNNRTVILDFGLARSVSDKRHVTKVGEIVGTPAYLSPEQARGETVDHRTDLFSLGSVLYRMVTGHNPFEGTDTVSLLLSLVQDSPTAPNDIDERIPKELSDLILQLLSKNPEQRPASAEDVAQALSSMLQPAEQSDRSNRRIWFAGLFAILVIVAVLSVLWFNRPQEETGIAQDRQFVGHNGRVNCVVFSPDGKLLLSGGEDCTVRLWNVETGREVRQFVGHSQPVTCIAFFDGMKAITSSRDGTLRLWELGSAKQIGIFRAEAFDEIALMNGGEHFLSAGKDRTIRAWKVADQLQKRLIQLPKNIRVLAFSQDGQYALTSSDSSDAGLYDLLSEDHIYFVSHKAQRGAFSPDGNSFVTSGVDGQVKAWAFHDGKALTTMQGHQGAACIAISPDSHLLLTGDDEGMLRLWDVNSGTELARKKSVESVDLAFSPDGLSAAIAGKDGIIRLWKLP